MNRMYWLFLLLSRCLFNRIKFILSYFAVGFLFASLLICHLNCFLRVLKRSITWKLLKPHRSKLYLANHTHCGIYRKALEHIVFMRSTWSDPNNTCNLVSVRLAGSFFNLSRFIIWTGRRRLSLHERNGLSLLKPYRNWQYFAWLILCTRIWIAYRIPIMLTRQQT